MDLVIQRLFYFRKHLNLHFVGFSSCIYNLDIPLTSGKTGMQNIPIDHGLITHDCRRVYINKMITVHLVYCETWSLWKVRIVHIGHADLHYSSNLVSRKTPRTSHLILAIVEPSSPCSKVGKDHFFIEVETRHQEDQGRELAK